TLSILNLVNNDIGNEGAQHLANGLRNNTAITEINLVNTQIGAKGAQYLLDALRNNTTLIKLNFLSLASTAHGLRPPMLELHDHMIKSIRSLSFIRSLFFILIQRQMNTSIRYFQTRSEQAQDQVDASADDTIL
ncbi:unnamed protein product, partial [Rotaria magnacalcarata]